MTASSSKTFRRVVLTAAVALPLLTMAARACFAYSEEARQMCTGDAFRLCSSDIPNISKVTACMVKHRSELSSGCRAVMDRNASQKPQTVAAQ
jgi:hypothetical protein